MAHSKHIAPKIDTIISKLLSLREEIELSRKSNSDPKVISKYADYQTNT